MNDSATLQVALVCDLLEERWPSMDLVADELFRALPSVPTPRVEPVRFRPAMPRWPAVLARATHIRAAMNANRYWDRHRRYPRWLRQHRGGYAAYHVVDHTYAHLVHELPADRTIVTCHDVDAFRSLFEHEPRSGMFQRMTQQVLDGLRRAAIVACDSVATRDALVTHGLRTNRLEVVPLGVHPAFTPAPRDNVSSKDEMMLLHVGSTIPRKRIDTLLRVFALVRREVPDVRLVRVGGPFTDEQTQLVRSLGLEAAITVMPVVTHEALADLYRRAALVLLPSEREGFGFPVAEAMACATPVVASDLQVLREVGGAGDGIAYAPVGDIDVWAKAVCNWLAERRDAPERWRQRRRSAADQASAFTWARCAHRMAELYAEVAHG